MVSSTNSEASGSPGSPSRQAGPADRPTHRRPTGFTESPATEAKRLAVQKLNPLLDRQAFDDAFGDYLASLVADRTN